MPANRPLTLMIGIALGVTAMYLLDPSGGRRRRALIRDRTRRSARRVRGAVGRASRHTANRTRGVAAELARGWKADRPNDEVLAQRVRSAIGRVVSHPAAIDVTANAGIVRLEGPILASDVDAVLAKTRGVRGVRAVDHALEVHDSPENTPALQGGGFDDRPEDSWSALAKLLAGFGSAVAIGARIAKASGSTTVAERP
jgi:hypothetical protein